VQIELDAVWTRKFHDTARQYTPPEVIVDDTTSTDGGPVPGGGRGKPGRRLDPDTDRAYTNARTGTIYFPSRYLTAVHAAHGPRAHLVLTFTMGHEFGHRVQFLLHPHPEARVNDLEAQADCYAGIWARQEADAGELDIEQFRAAASAELHRLSSYRNEVATHGRPAQRIASLDKGLSSHEPASCDQGELTWLPRRFAGPPA
jgi:predicted metalloprotease